MVAKAQQEKEQLEVQKTIKEVYEDGVATINGTDYVFSKFKHHERLKVVELIQDATNQITGEMKLPWTSKQFQEVENLINSKVLVDDMQISKFKDYWDQDENTADYMTFITTAMHVITYPFTKGKAGV